MEQGEAKESRRKFAAANAAADDLHEEEHGHAEPADDPSAGERQRDILARLLARERRRQEKKGHAEVTSLQLASGAHVGLC